MWICWYSLTCVWNFGLLGISYRFDFKKEISVLSLTVRLQLIQIINLFFQTFLLEEASSVTLLQPEKLTDTTENSSGSCFDVCEFEGAKFNSMEDQITMNFLKNFKPGEILTFDNADPRYKKLRDEIIEYVLQDLKRNVLPGDGNHTLSPSQGLSRKNRLVFLSVIIWFIAILVILFCTPDADCGLVATWTIPLKWYSISS